MSVDMSGETLRDDVELAHRLADVAVETAVAHFREGTARWSKPDGTPASAADLATEQAMLELLERHRTVDAVLSEEAGSINSGRRRWLLDPIDGTDAFLAGGSAWGNHIALEIDGQVTIGIVTRPLLGLRWWAVHGQGAYRSTQTEPTSRARRLEVSPTAVLAKARLSGWLRPGSRVAAQLGGRATWVDLQDALCIVDQVAEGRLDAFVAEEGAEWDLAPQALVVTEAGGVFQDPQGGTRLDLGAGIYSNGRLAHEVRAALPLAWPLT
jgi:histidinol-phosphatase